MKITKKLSFLVAAGLAGTGAAFAETVFEVPAGQNSFYSTALEYGDQVEIAGYPGVGWTLTSISIPYYANYGATGGLSVKIYGNDAGGNAPGSVLYSSPPIDILDNGGTVTIPFAEIADNLLPSSTFTYTVSFNGVGGANVAGLYVPDTIPSVGTSKDDFWEKGAGGWELRKITGDIANFQVTITAVPEPGVVALASLGLAGLLFVAARNRKA